MVSEFIKYILNLFCNNTMVLEGSLGDSLSSDIVKSKVSDFRIYIDNLEMHLRSEGVQTVKDNFRELNNLIRLESEDISSSELQKLRRTLRSKYYHLTISKENLDLWESTSENIEVVDTSTLFVPYYLQKFALIDYDPIKIQIALVIREINRSLKRRRLNKTEAVKSFLFSSFVKTKVLFFSFARPKGNHYSLVSQNVRICEWFCIITESELKNEEARFSKNPTRTRLCLN